MKPTLSGLKIDPCIPESWRGFTVTRRFRGATFVIRVENPDGHCSGVRSLLVNGKEISGNDIPVTKDDAGKVFHVTARI